MYRRRKHAAPGILLLVVLLGLLLPSAILAAPFVDGTAFHDYNFNGQQDSGSFTEPGLAGILVNVYVGGLITPSATTTTQADGTYMLDLASTGAVAGDAVRIEFVIPAPMNAYLVPGRHNDAIMNGESTTVRFVNAYDPVSSGSVDLALVNPSHYCHSTNPPLTSSCFAFGDQTNNQTVTVMFPYQSGSTDPYANSVDTSTGYTILTVANEVGSVWGTAYGRRTDDVFLAAFARRHSGYRPGGLPGEIYRYNRPTDTVSTLVILPAGADNHDTTDYLNDTPFWNDVGTVGLGDIDISDDEETLYAVNLFDRRIYAIDIATGTYSSESIPFPVDCNPDWVRPGALKYNNRALFMGLTCTGPLQSDLRAYVYTNGVQVANFPLTYGRAQTSDPNPPDTNLATWNPWASVPTRFDLAFGAFHYPQPWLLDIEFDAYNFMIASLADRFGFQAGNDNANAGDIEGVSAADMLRLSPNSPTNPTFWNLENNGSDGVNTTLGMGNGEGPGGGEFYFNDRFRMGNPLAPSFGLHREATLAGVVLVHGLGEIVTAGYDPSPNGNYRTGGVTWYSNTTGQRTRSFEIFNIDEAGTYGKAAGIGDVEALCGPAPLELGNFVWFDLDGDGRQSPGETPIAGVILILYIDHDNNPATPMLPVTTTVTDASGHYYFNEGNIPLMIDFDGSGVAGDNPNELMFYDITGNGTRDANEPAGVLPFKNYEIRIENPANFAPGGPLFEYYATNVISNGDEVNPNVDGSYRHNSNGNVTDFSSFVSGLNFASTGNFRTGDFGANDHTFDFGFNNTTLVATPTPTATPIAGPTSTGTPGTPGAPGAPGTGTPGAPNGATGTPKIQKLANVSFVSPGGEIVYTILVTNDTGFDISNYGFSDVVDERLEILATSAQSGSTTTAGNTVLYSIATLAANSSDTVTIRVRVKPNVEVPFVIENTVGDATVTILGGPQDLPDTGEKKQDD